MTSGYAYVCEIHFLLTMRSLITLPDSFIASQREKFSLSAATTRIRDSCGLTEAQSFCTCIFSLAKKAAKDLKNC